MIKNIIELRWKQSFSAPFNEFGNFLNEIEINPQLAP